MVNFTRARNTLFFSYNKTFPEYPPNPVGELVTKNCQLNGFLINRKGHKGFAEDTLAFGSAQADRVYVYERNYPPSPQRGN